MIVTLRHTLAATCLAAASLCASAAGSILKLTDHSADSTIVAPESVETDVQKMMQNWYLQTYTALDRQADSRPDVPTTDEELIKRLKAIPTTIELPFNSVVRSYIDIYTGKKRSLVETMLGMSLYYMPIFEQALEREGLPIELKYLPIIESALNPDAVSRSGATGLWQLMLPTARGLGMEVNTLVDERRDPVASSAAATKYLRQLYDIYKDWSLAIAAYNCGPGNVNKALRRASGDTSEANSMAPVPAQTDPSAPKRDFWSIYPYLPQETRGYVPCFIAATYVMNHYDKHNISPALAKRPIITDSVHVKRRVHFKQIADVLQIPVEELQILNPQYRCQEIPGDIRPSSLVLPANQIYSYIMSEDAIAARDAELYARRDVVEPATIPGPDNQEGEWVTVEDVKYHKVARNETMSTIARKYGVTVKQLKSANGNISRPKRGQSLKVVTTKKVFRPAEPQPQQQPAANDNLLVRNDNANAAAEQAAKDVAVAETASAAAEATEAPATETKPAAPTRKPGTAVPRPARKPAAEPAAEPAKVEAPAPQPEQPAQAPVAAEEEDAEADLPAIDDDPNAPADEEEIPAAEEAPAKAEPAPAPADNARKAAAAAAADNKVSNSFRSSRAKKDADAKKNAADNEAAAEEAPATPTKGRADKAAADSKNTKDKTTDKKNAKDKKEKQEAAPKTHTVKSGESLYIIAQRYNTTVPKLQKLNGIKKGAKLQPGDKIKVK